MPLNLVAVVSLVTVCLAVARASEQNQFVVSSESGRPLAVVAQHLQEWYGLIVTYEDPPYLSPSDWSDVTEAVRRDGMVTKRVLVPRGRTLDFRFPIERTSPSEKEVGLILAAAIQAAERSGHPGEFRIARPPSATRGNEPTVYHLIPTGTKGKSGKRQSYASLLDTRISLPVGETDGIRALLLLTEAVTHQGGRTLLMGVAPMQLLGRTKVLLGASNESARDVLWRTLKAAAPKLSWVVFCDPGEGAPCYLSIVQVVKK